MNIAAVTPTRGDRGRLLEQCKLYVGRQSLPFTSHIIVDNPPLDQRISAIDPQWDGKFQRVPDEKRDEVYRRETGTPPPLFEQPLARNILAGAIFADVGTPPVIHSTSVLPSLGNPTPQHLRYAEQLRDALPDTLRAAARDPLAATALIYALILAPDEKLRAEQLAEIAKRISPDVSKNAAALYPDVAATARRARLPLVNLAIGSLRNLEPHDFAKFTGTLDWLVGSDGQVELFEFVLQKIVQRHLGPKFGVGRAATVQFYTLKPLVPDCAAVLSALANVGSDDAGEVQKAFAAGAPWLRAPADVPLELLSRESCGVEIIGAALDRLALAAPIIKKNLLEACARAVGADGVILETEAELLRAVADTLDCPMPPLGVEA